MELIDPARFHRASWVGADAPVVNFVLPCYNEEAVLRETAGRLGVLLAELKAEGLIAPASSASPVAMMTSGAAGTQAGVMPRNGAGMAR